MRIEHTGQGRAGRGTTRSARSVLPASPRLQTLSMNDLRLLIEPGERVAVAGASGYVGGRLVPLLLAAGYSVRCLARDERKARARPWSGEPGIEVVRCSLDNPAEVREALRGCAAAYYLVHAMMSSGPKFATVDEVLARTFGLAASEAGVRRLIYLGGLGDEAEGLSQHLASRRGVESALRAAGVPVTTLRAAMLIGAGSASFEILRYLVERLPVMVTPRWVRTESQPIAIRDALHYLIACLGTPETSGLTLDIGGPDVLSYNQLMRIMAKELGLPRRLVIPVGVLTPGLSSRWIHLVTPISHRLARPLAEGLRNRMVCSDDRAVRLMRAPLLGAREAIAHAVADHRAGNTPTFWSDAGVMPGDPAWAGGTEFHDRRERLAWAPREAVFAALSQIGGSRGYFAASLLWRIRGILDRLVGGPGLRRGRRDPRELRFGDAVDFWRVTGLDPGRSVELTAEMRLPGEARLRWRLEPRPGGRTLVEQTATFRPRGLSGLAYWWSVLPLHGPVFDGMLRGLCQAAEAAGPGPPAARPRGPLTLLRVESTVPRTQDDTFAFFSDARNLDRLTPSSVSFRILTPTPIAMRVGALIDYRIRVRGVPLRWRTRIEAWEPPHRFIDVQLNGPYRWWHHEHRFEPCSEGTRVIDEVEYAAPFRRLTHPLIVRRDVDRIFRYRAQALGRELGPLPSPKPSSPEFPPEPSPRRPTPHISVV